MGAGNGRSRRARAGMNPGQAQFLADKLGDAIAGQPEWGEFSRRLLGVGGEAIAAVHETDMGLLLESGKQWPAEGALLIKGRESGCHDNSAALHRSDPARRVVTGWALSTDGIWRQHSWCVAAAGGADVVVETTTPRVSYYGSELSGDALEQFLDSNW